MVCCSCSLGLLSASRKKVLPGSRGLPSISRPALSSNRVLFTLPRIGSVNCGLCHANATTRTTGCSLNDGTKVSIRRPAMAVNFSVCFDTDNNGIASYLSAWTKQISRSGSFLEAPQGAELRLKSFHRSENIRWSSRAYKNDEHAAIFSSALLVRRERMLAMVAYRPQGWLRPLPPLWKNL